MEIQIYGVENCRQLNKKFSSYIPYNPSYTEIYLKFYNTTKFVLLCNFSKKLDFIVTLNFRPLTPINTIIIHIQLIFNNLFPVIFEINLMGEKVKIGEKKNKRTCSRVPFLFGSACSICLMQKGDSFIKKQKFSNLFEKPHHFGCS